MFAQFFTSILLTKSYNFFPLPQINLHTMHSFNFMFGNVDQFLCFFFFFSVRNNEDGDKICMLEIPKRKENDEKEFHSLFFFFFLFFLLDCVRFMKHTMSITRSMRIFCVRQIITCDDENWIFHACFLSNCFVYVMEFIYSLYRLRLFFFLFY